MDLSPRFAICTPCKVPLQPSVGILKAVETGMHQSIWIYMAADMFVRFSALLCKAVKPPAKEYAEGRKPYGKAAPYSGSPKIEYETAKIPYGK